jgi:hypothetical protein
MQGMRTMLPVVAVAVLSVVVAAAQDGPKTPKDSVQLSASGCLKGRVLTISDTPEVVDGGELDVPVHRFQLSGKKPLMAEVKRHDRERVDVTGFVRKLDLKEPGLRVPGGRILISPGQGQDSHRAPSRPIDRVILLELVEFRPSGVRCGE